MIAPNHPDGNIESGDDPEQHWSFRREQSATIEAIQQLHQICTPPAAIAKRLHLSEADVRFCIQRGRFPQAGLFETEVTE